VIPCWKDIETLELYLDMETLRWDRKINYSIRVDPMIRNGDYKVPPMIIQPFVENAIHHGLLNKSGNDKRVDISVDLEKESIRYTIVDNGVGRTKAAEFKNLNKPSHASYGIQITKDRIEMFNQGQEQSVRITDLYNEQNEAAGTKVEVWLAVQNA
jgi:LytS/YehU family sensor histidine kinase